MKFCLPYIDQPISFWRELAKSHKENIEEIYFPMQDNIVKSGRPIQPNTYIDSFLEKVDLPKAVLINPIILSHPMEVVEEPILNELIKFNEKYGIYKVTVSNPLLCKSIKSLSKEFQISASTLMKINSPEQIPYIVNYLAAITLDTAIVRDLKKIKDIRDNFTGLIKLIVNEGCLSGCPFRIQHFYEMSCNLPYPQSLCNELLADLPWLRLKSAWILPQHLHFYEGLYDIIKLAGRVTLQNPQQYMEVFHAYLNRTAIATTKIGCGPAGMIKDIPISEDFFYTTITCDKNCVQCNVCQRYYEQYG